MVTIKFKQYYIGCHGKTKWCTVLNESQAHKFSTRAIAEEFILNSMKMNLKCSVIEIMEVV